MSECGEICWKRKVTCSQKLLKHWGYVSYMWLLFWIVLIVTYKHIGSSCIFDQCMVLTHYGAVVLTQIQSEEKLIFLCFIRESNVTHSSQTLSKMPSLCVADRQGKRGAWRGRGGTGGRREKQTTSMQAKFCTAANFLKKELAHMQTSGRQCGQA